MPMHAYNAYNTYTDHFLVGCAKNWLFFANNYVHVRP